MSEHYKYRLLPPLPGERHAALRHDIAAMGLLTPIVVDEHGKVLDGFERELVCAELGIKSVPFVIRPGLTEEQKIDYIVNTNLARRYLDKRQLKTLAADLRGRGWTQEKIRKVLGITQKTVSNWLNEEFRNFTEPTTVTGKDGKSYPAKRRERLKLEQVQEQKRESRDTKDAKIRLLLDDLRECGRQIERRSIHLLLTTSPGDYPELWHELAILGERVLKPGKLLVFCSGQARLPEMIGALSKRLQYVWTGSVVLNNDPHPVSELHIDNESKLLLFFARRPYQPGPWFDDTFLEEGIDGHGMETLIIEQLTNPGDLICDPLAADRVAIAAGQLKRRFIGTRQDPTVLPKAKEKMQTAHSTSAGPMETVFPNRLQLLINKSVGRLLSRVGGREKA